MSPWERLLERPHSRGHFVQLYEADEVRSPRMSGTISGKACGAARVCWSSQRRSTRSFSLGIWISLGADLPVFRDSRQLVFWDAQETLGQFIGWRSSLNGGALRRSYEQRCAKSIRRRAEGLRAYGEMVGILWKARQFAAAIRLEQLWNKLLENSSFSLYCAYAIDVFGKDFEVANLDGVLCTHTHLVPAQPDGTLETALNRSMDEILGPKADALRVLIKANYRPAWAVMPAAEAIVLWLRKNLPEQADHIVARARHHYNSLLQPAGSISALE